jgi:predicted transcriptional regulator
MTDKTTVELAKDLHERIGFVADARKTNIKTEIRNAVVAYLERDDVRAEIRNAAARRLEMA